jgi:hypothetical protein
VERDEVIARLELVIHTLKREGWVFPFETVAVTPEGRVRLLVRDVDNGVDAAIARLDSRLQVELQTTTGRHAILPPLPA